MSDNLPALVDYSKALAASDLLPDAYRGKPANVLVAIEYGKALGLNPMAAIQGITVIKGKPTASASLMAGLVRNAGHKLRVTGDDKRAECIIIRSDDPDFEFKTVWTIDRAKKAGLTSNPTWAKYPDAMLKARAISECARNACSEILAGVQYTSEELGGTEEPATVTARRATPPRSKAVTSSVPAAERPTVSEPDFDQPTPELEPEHAETVDAEIVDDGEPLITDGQMKALHAGLTGMGIKDRDTGLGLIGGLIGREIQSTKKLTRSEAHRVLSSWAADDDSEQ